MPSLLRPYEQFKTLNGYFDVRYAEMTNVIGPPDIDDGVKGIIEWWSLGTENVAFSYFYPNWEMREKPDGLSIFFRTWYGHRRCFVDRRSDLTFLSFARFYWLECTAVIKTDHELKRRDQAYRSKLARMSAQPTPAAARREQ